MRSATPDSKLKVSKKITSDDAYEHTFPDEKEVDGGDAGANKETNAIAIAAINAVAGCTRRAKVIKTTKNI